VLPIKKGLLLASLLSIGPSAFAVSIKIYDHLAGVMGGRPLVLEFKPSDTLELIVQRLTYFELGRTGFVLRAWKGGTVSRLTLLENVKTLADYGLKDGDELVITPKAWCSPAERASAASKANEKALGAGGGSAAPLPVSPAEGGKQQVALNPESVGSGSLEHLGEKGLALWEAVVGGDPAKVRLLASQLPKSERAMVLGWRIPAKRLEGVSFDFVHLENGFDLGIPEKEKKSLFALEKERFPNSGDNRRGRWFMENNTMLLYALSIENMEVAFALLESGADPFVLNDVGISFDYMISMAVDVPVARILEFISKVKAKDPEKFTISVQRIGPNNNTAMCNYLYYCERHTEDDHLAFVGGCHRLGMPADTSACGTRFFEQVLRFSPRLVEAYAALVPEAFQAQVLWSSSKARVNPYLLAWSACKPASSFQQVGLEELSAIQTMFEIFIKNKIPLFDYSAPTPMGGDPLVATLVRVLSEGGDYPVVKARREMARRWLQMMSEAIASKAAVNATEQAYDEKQRQFILASLHGKERVL
jgi:hypothetical protein